MITRQLLPLLLLAVLTACDTTASLRELRHAAPSENPYFVALAEQYRDFAELQVKRYDWWSSKYFADKGLIVAYGHEVDPELPENWDISPSERQSFTSAREALMRALTQNAKTLQPKQAASAMFHYDCWLETSDDGWRKDEIETCRDGFFAALHALEDTGSDSDIAPPTPLVSTSNVLYFPFDREVLEGEFLKQIRGLVESLKAHPNAQIVINGHADRAGDDTYNLSLSAKRAEYIERLLIEAGVEKSRISYFAFGESDPAVNTEDDVRERANRRVEIFLE